MRTKKTTTEEQTAGAAPMIEKKTKAKRGRPSKKTTAQAPTEEAPTKEAKTEEAKKPVKAPKVTKVPKATKTTKATKKQKVEKTVEAQPAETKQVETTTKAEIKPAELKKTEAKPVVPQEPKPVVIPALPNVKINSISDLMQAPKSAIVLNDQQIQQLTLEEIEKRYQFLTEMLVNVLDYDVVISDTNIWLELLLGHVSSHSDPRVNARLMFERQLEFISKLMKQRGGKFMMMGETYEEIDRFAAMQDPTNHKEADFTDNIVCLNAAARLAKRLILAQQRENRLRIEGITAESHHAAFADPAIVRRVVELFAEGKKILLLTNDSSVAIRSVGLCDDLQRINDISDEAWDNDYAPLRPMVFNFDDLKLLDNYTRQLHYIQMAAGKSWMDEVNRLNSRKTIEKLTLDMEAFRPGDKHRGDNLFIGAEPENVTNQKQQQQPKQQQKQQQQQKSKQKQKQQQQKQQQQQQQKKAEDDDTFIVVEEIKD